MRSHIIRSGFNPGAKFIILFINPNVHSTIATQNTLAFQLFQLMYDRYNAANVVFLYAFDYNVYSVYVTNPYQNKTHCGNHLIRMVFFFVPLEFLEFNLVVDFIYKVRCNRFYWTRV